MLNTCNRCYNTNMLKRLYWLLLLLVPCVMGEYAAVVNGTTINAVAFDKLYKESIREYKSYLLFDSDSELSLQDIEDIKRSVIDDLIEHTLIKEFAQREGIRVDEEEVKTEIDTMMSNFPSRESFWRALKEQNIHFEVLAENMKTQLLKDKVLSSMHPEYDEISTDDVIVYLKRNKLFIVPVQYNITLLVSDNRQYLEALIENEPEEWSWTALALNPEWSYESWIVSEEDLPLSVAEVIVSIDLHVFSPVTPLDSANLFTARINEIVNMPSFDLNSISRSVKDSLREEKKNRFFQEWIQDQKMNSDIRLNPDIFPTPNATNDKWIEDDGYEPLMVEKKREYV